MNLPAGLFPDTWHWAALLCALGIVLRLARTAPWVRLARADQLHLLLGISVSLALLWSMSAGVMPGLNLHLLGAMAATLALGPHFAIVALGLALTGITLNGTIEWQAWPLNFLLMSVAPICIAHALRRTIEHFLRPHFFIFVFAVAFFGSAATIILVGLAASLLLMFAGTYPFAFLASDYLPYLLLLGFAEAWMGGAVISLLVVYKPQWVAAFDDRRYLLDK